MEKDSTCQGSDEVNEIYCEVCKPKGKTRPAEGFCVDCVKYFCTVCLEYHSEFLPDHIQQDKQSMPQEVCLKPCLAHPSEIIKFYCSECESFFCSLCKVTNHQKCSGVTHLPELVSKIDLQTKYRDDSEILEKLLKNIKERDIFVQTKLEEIETFASKARDTLSAQKAEVLLWLENNFSKINGEIADIHSKGVADLNTEKAELGSLSNQTVKLKTDLESKVKANNKCELYMFLKQAESKRQEMEANLAKVKNRQLTIIVFEPSGDVINVLCERLLGKIITQTIDLNIPDSETQKSIVSEGLKKPLVEGDIRHVISAGWWKKWQICVQYGSWDMCVSRTPPGPIDNSDIITEKSLKQHLIDDLDYVLVPSVVWDQMVKWYGIVPGQTPLPRQVILEGIYGKSLKVEVYPWLIKLAEECNQDKQIVEYFSRSSTIAKMEDKMREIFSIPRDRPVRLWYRYMTNMYEQLRSRELTVQEAGLYQGQIIIIEQQNSDGTWPRDGLRTKGNNASKKT